MLVTYPTRYQDRSGAVTTSITNDGQHLRMVLRGVEFTGRCFDDWEPVEGTDPALLTSFTFAEGGLCSCLIECQIPVAVVVNGRDEQGELLVRLELGNPRPKPRGGIDKEELTLELAVGPAHFRSSSKGGWFDIALAEIQGQLSEGTYVKACINCAFSDYYPAGHGLFGCLACFRGNKQGYRAVKNKGDLFAVWDTMTEFVQETYLCPEFERRIPGTGYRG